MNILFLTLSRIKNLDDRGLYHDLMRYLRAQGHSVFIVTPAERRFKEATQLHTEKRLTVLSVKTLNIQKTNILEKGLGTLLIERQYQQAIKKYLPEKMDLVIYSTPPITFSNVIRFIRKRDQAKTYLLLKDIFPQNAVDLGMMKQNGLMHRFFVKKEKTLYSLSDYIGCMSPANVRFLLEHNPEISSEKVEVCPNSIEPLVSWLPKDEKQKIRVDLGVPTDSTVFIYGGNLGKPQGVDFLLRVLEENVAKTDRYFVIVGTGTEFSKIQAWFDKHQPMNAQLLKGLPKHDYDRLIQACDVGMIFLDPRFTIPNYPSRLLAYLENKMPVLIASDENTDIGTMADQYGYGFWTVSGNLAEFNKRIDQLAGNRALIQQMGQNGYGFLMENYTVEQSCQIIMKHFETDV